MQTDLFNSEPLLQFPAVVYLANRDSKGAIRIVKMSCEWDDGAYIISRTTGIFNKKQINQPEIAIRKGKSNRTVTEQARLEYKSKLKEYKDKGYKELEKLPSEYSKEELDNIVGEYKTSQEGLLKPMLAKQYQDVTRQSTFDKQYYGSRKINGVRCILFYDGKKIRAHSRGSIYYDFVLDHIVTHPLLIKLFEKNPTLMLDGEIYKHGWTLNKISGICRSQQTAYDGDPLEFYWYDIVDVNKPFKDRLKIMNAISKVLNLSFNPEREWGKEDLKIQYVPQVLVSGFDNMLKLHDEYVSDGWEGLVIRNVDSVYKPGGRSSDMIKIKKYYDSEYKIIGLKEGLREEDMCFVMVTSNGQEFNAKPVGDREQKKWYREHINQLIGKMATLKYFEMSGKEGSEIPQQPIFLGVRDLEM